MGYNGSRKYLPPIAVTRQRMVLAVGANGVYLMQSGEVFEDFKLSFNLSYEEVDGYPFTIYFMKQDHQNYERLFWNTHDLMVGHVHRVDGVDQWVGYSNGLASRIADQDLIELIITEGNGVLKINGVSGGNLPCVHPAGTIELRAANPVTIENLNIEEL